MRKTILFVAIFINLLSNSYGVDQLNPTPPYPSAIARAPFQYPALNLSSESRHPDERATFNELCLCPSCITTVANLRAQQRQTAYPTAQGLPTPPPINPFPQHPFYGMVNPHAHQPVQGLPIPPSIPLPQSSFYGMVYLYRYQTTQAASTTIPEQGVVIINRDLPPYPGRRRSGAPTIFFGKIFTRRLSGGVNPDRLFTAFIRQFFGHLEDELSIQFVNVHTGVGVGFMQIMGRDGRKKTNNINSALRYILSWNRRVDMFDENTMGEIYALVDNSADWSITSHRVRIELQETHRQRNR